MPKRKQLKTIPKFKSETEEREFWETQDTADYIDWSGAKATAFPNLKPSTQTISLRLPLGILIALKTLANKRDIPYQSLLKVFLAERIASELDRERSLEAPKKKRRVRGKTSRR